MGTIFYGLAGEGRGHATRVRTIVEDLRKEHRIVIYAPSDAYDFLAPIYKNTDVTVRPIDGLSWQYDRWNRLNYARSFLHALQYIVDLPWKLARLVNDIEREQPDLVITDFDPLLPRAAQRTGCPFISLNHQHFLVTYDLNSLPPGLKTKADILAQAVPLFYSGQRETVVSSFYFPPLRDDLRDDLAKVTQIGVLLRNEITRITPEHGDHLVVYLRKFTTPQVMEALKSTGREVRIYGLGEQPSRGNLVFRPIDNRRFIEDLATSEALISTAGNQVVGEALFLGKPVLGMPESGNFEQEINGHFLEKSRTGVSVHMEEMNREIMKSFLLRIDALRESIDRDRLFGNPDALAIINRNIREVTEISGDDKMNEMERKIAV